MHGETMKCPKYVEIILINNKSPFAASSWSHNYLHISVGWTGRILLFILPFTSTSIAPAAKSYKLSH